MTRKSVLGEVREVQLAVELIGLGARLQFLEAAVALSRERLIRLYKELEADESELPALIKAYRLYTEQVGSQGGEVVLDFTRAETMVRFFDSDMLQLSTCCRCGGHFVAHAHDNKNGYVCVLCRPPSRAGKARKPKVAEVRRGGLISVGPVLDIGGAV